MELGYDAARHWLERIETTLNGSKIQDLEYAHYGNGQIHERITPNRAQEYQYDALGRLGSLTNFGAGYSSAPHEFGYDSHGNLVQNDGLTNQYPASTPHLPNLVGDNSYTYHPNGNLLARSGVSVPGGTQTITYTSFDLPRQIVTGTTNPLVTQFEYTADAERVVRRDDSGARHFVGGLYQRLVSPTGSTVEERFQIQTGGGTAEVVRANGSEKILYMHADHLGTPDTISDNGGAVIRQAYGPFGDLIGSPPGINQDPTRIGFTGHQQDNDLGFTDMGGRVYDPLAARFLTSDPVMQAPYLGQGQNRYAYVFNDPINQTDPSGFITTGSTGGDITTGAVLGAGYGLVGYGVATELGANISINAAGSGLGSALGGLANVITTVAMNPFGSRPGYSHTGAAPASAPTSNAFKPNGSSAMANNHGSQPLSGQVQERGGRPSLFDRGRGALAANESDSDSAVKNPFLKFEHKLDSSFKPVGPVELGDFSPGKAPDMGSAPRRTLDLPGPDEVTSVWDHNIKQKYLDELSKLDPSPGKYLLEQNKPLLKAQGNRLLSQINESPINWVPIALVGGGLATIVVVAAVNCGRDGVDCSFK
jgi:RHS repeat-associated protein